MRHVRKLGLCLVAACAVAALGATSAQAIKNPTRSIGIYKNCPVHSELNGFRDAACVFAATEIGEKGTSAGGKFTVGPITTPIEKQITLQYGDNEHEVEGAEFGVVEEVIAPTDGAEIIVPTPEKVPGEPIGHVTATEQEELGWPATLKYSYATHKSQEKHVTETIELAGARLERQIPLHLRRKHGLRYRTDQDQSGQPVAQRPRRRLLCRLERRTDRSAPDDRRNGIATYGRKTTRLRR